jgi:hypothetical protein
MLQSQLNNYYNTNTIKSVDESVTNIQDLFNNSTNLVCNLNNILKTIKYNEQNINKVTLSRLAQTGDLICNTNKYKDSIDNIVSESNETIIEIQKEISKLTKKIGSYDITRVLSETLQQVKNIERQLKSIYDSILKPIETMKKAIPKIHENLAKDTLKENEIISEHTMVTYFKLEYIINNINNTELSNGWKVLCENKIYNIMSSVNWSDICIRLSEKYKNFETKKDIYYYFCDGDKLQESTNLTIKQEKLTLDPQIITIFNSLSISIGNILNEYLLLYEFKIKKIQNFPSVKSYNYPIIPVTDSKSMFLTRAFNKPNNYDPLIGAGIVPGNGGFVSFDDLEINFNASGDFIISKNRPNLLNAYGKNKKTTNKNLKRPSDGDEPEPKKPKLIQNNTMLNTQLFSDISMSIKNISRLKSQISRTNNDNLIENLISIDSFLSIENQNNILSSNTKSFMVCETELQRARNHLNYALISDERSKMYTSILKLFETILDKTMLELKKIHNTNTDKLLLEHFFIKSNVIVMIVAKIESICDYVQIKDVLTIKHNEYLFKDENKNLTKEILKARFSKYFEKSKVDSKRISMKNEKIGALIAKCYKNKIESIKLINEEINESRANNKKILESYFLTEDSIVNFFKQQNNIDPNNNIFKIQDSIEKLETCVNEMIQLGGNYLKFIKNFKLEQIIKKYKNQCLQDPDRYKDLLGRNLRQLTDTLPKEFHIDSSQNDVLNFLHSLNNVSNDVIWFRLNLNINPNYQINYYINNKLLTKYNISVILKVFSNFNSSDPYNFFTSNDDTDYMAKLNEYIEQVKASLELISDKLQLENPEDYTNIVDLIQSTCLDILFKRECNYIIRPIGPSACGKSTFMFGTKSNSGLITDILNINTADSFFYFESYMVTFPMVEAIGIATKRPRIDLYFQDINGNYNVESSDKFSFDKKYRIKKLTDYTSFTDRVTELKTNQSKTIKDSGINKNSSRGFSLIIVELIGSNNKKYYKTVLDSPGLETIISMNNTNARVDANCESYLFWSNPLIVFYLATKNCLKYSLDEFNYEIALNTNHAIDLKYLSLIDSKDVSTFLSNTNKNNLPKFKKEVHSNIQKSMANLIFGKNLFKDLKIEKEFWLLKIGPEISKSLVNDKYINEFGIKEESVTLEEFFNVESLRKLLNKQELSLSDMINPLFGVPMIDRNITQIGNTFYYTVQKIKQNQNIVNYVHPFDYYSSENLLPSINKETQNLIISNLTFVVFFISFYAFYYRYFKNPENVLEPIQKMKEEVFPLAFPNTSFYNYVDLFFESIIINEINLLYMCNNKNGNIFNKKNNSNLKSANNLCTQMYMAVYFGKDIDYIKGSFLKLAFKNNYYNDCSIAVKNINEFILKNNFDDTGRENYNLNNEYSSLSVVNLSKINQLCKIYNSNTINNYIFNEHFCDKSSLFVETDTYEKSLFLKSSNTLDIIVLSATLLEKEERENRENALEAYVNLFLFNKNSNQVPFRI